MAERSGIKLAAYVALGVAMAVVVSVEQVPVPVIAPDAGSYASLAQNMSEWDGYRIDTETLPLEPEASRYPPGYPLMLAPLVWAMDVGSAAVLISVALVVAVWWAARSIGGGVAAIVAVLSLVISTPFRYSAGTVMADIPAALLTVLALIGLRAGRPLLAGALGAFSVWVRMAQIVVVLALPRRTWPIFATGVVALGVSKALLGWGYEKGQLGWSVQHVWSTAGLESGPTALSNAAYYPALLLGLWGGVMLPGVLVLASVAAWRRGGAERRFFFGSLGGFLLVYVPYFWQDDRFAFPVMALSVIYAGVFAAELVSPKSAPETPRSEDHTVVVEVVAGQRRHQSA